MRSYTFVAVLTLGFVLRVWLQRPSATVAATTIRPAGVGRRAFRNSCAPATRQEFDRGSRAPRFGFSAAIEPSTRAKSAPRCVMAHCGRHELWGNPFAGFALQSVKQV